MEDGVVNEKMSGGLGNCIVNVSFERKLLVVSVVPIIIAAPVAVEIEISDVVAARFVAECLVKYRRERARYLAIPGTGLREGRHRS